MTATEDFKLKTDTPYLTLTGKLWGVYYANLEENLQSYKSHVINQFHCLGQL